MTDRVDFLKSLRATFAGIATACLPVSAAAAWSVGQPSVVSAFGVWLFAVSAATLVGAIVATVFAVALHVDYREALRSN